MREPSIHITKSQFEEILNTLEVDNFPVEAFFVIARKEAINHRAVLVSNNKNTKRVNNILLASKGDAALVADILYATRIKLKHRGVRKINESNSREWANCKKLAEICNTFCEDFKFDTREGFIKYIETGLKRMTDYRNVMQRLISMQDNITNQTEAEIKLQSADLELTAKVHDYFVSKIAKATGIYESYENQPEKYVHFAYVAASSTYDGDRATHIATNLIDGKRETNWTEGVDGNGIGEYVHFEFQEKHTITGFRICSGNHSSDSYYAKNARPKEIKLTFEDGSSEQFTLLDVKEEFTFQLSEAITTKNVRLTIQSVYEGSSWEDTVISEIVFLAAK